MPFNSLVKGTSHLKNIRYLFRFCSIITFNSDKRNISNFAKIIRLKLLFSINQTFFILKRGSQNRNWCPSVEK